LDHILSSNRLRGANIRKEPSNRLDSPIVNSEVDIQVGGRNRLEKAYLGGGMYLAVGRFMWRLAYLLFRGGKF
jgi:hypothetical protein